jgi:hypothetical protein
MRDPLDSKVEAARAEARKLISWWVDGLVASEEQVARIKTWNWLMTATAGASSGRCFGPPPPEVLDYIYRLMDPVQIELADHKRGRRANTTRDGFLVQVIAQLVRKYGLDATRNEASPRPSACSIVAQVLNENRRRTITERAINTVWSRREEFDIKGLFDDIPDRPVPDWRWPF